MVNPLLFDNAEEWDEDEYFDVFKELRILFNNGYVDDGRLPAIVSFYDKKNHIYYVESTTDIEQDWIKWRGGPYQEEDRWMFAIMEICHPRYLETRKKYYVNQYKNQETEPEDEIIDARKNYMIIDYDNFSGGVKIGNKLSGEECWLWKDNDKDKEAPFYFKHRRAYWHEHIILRDTSLALKEDYFPNYKVRCFETFHKSYFSFYMMADEYLDDIKDFCIKYFKGEL